MYFCKIEMNKIIKSIIFKLKLYKYINKIFKEIDVIF